MILIVSNYVMITFLNINQFVNKSTEENIDSKCNNRLYPHMCVLRCICT